VSEQRSRQSLLNKEREGDFIQFTIYYNSKSDVLKPGPARWVDQRPVRPGAGIGPGGSKNLSGSWPGKIRSTRVNLGVTQLCFLIYI